MSNVLINFPHNLTRESISVKYAEKGSSDKGARIILRENGFVFVRNGFPRFAFLISAHNFNHYINHALIRWNLQNYISGVT